MSEAMVDVESVCKRYGNTDALRELSLKVEAGASCAVVGPSGCGKTTLLHLLAALDSPDEGTISVAGEPLAGLRPSTGLVLQEGALLPWKSAEGNVAVGLRARRLPQKEIVRRCSEMLAAVGLAEHAHKYPVQLSGGEQQRVAIARTLVTEPDLLLMDEPTAALDEMTKEALQDLILELHLRSRRTMIFVTHSIEEAVFLGHRVLLMEAGSIAEEFHNPHFGKRDLRSREEFYALVLRIRRRLGGGKAA
jgi:NitT/TauT family transport system ATP-binding protein